MHSAYQRLNIASALISSCLFALLVGIALTSYVHETSPTGSLTVDSLKVLVQDTTILCLPCSFGTQENWQSAIQL
jgi:hypothetical protein